MKRKLFSINITYIFPIAILLFLVLIFTFTTGGKLLGRNNLRYILNEVVPLVIGGLGMIFVVAQGSVDISLGSIVALTGTVMAILSADFPLPMLFPLALLIGALAGCLNGVLVGRFKVPSITVTLATSIGLRAYVAYITSGKAIFVAKEVLILDKFAQKMLIFIAAILVMGYLYEYTRLGYYSKAIGENEVAGMFTGIAVRNMKVIAFVLSGMMAGLVGLMTVGRVGGANNTLGNMYELQVLLALFVGGVPVEGGMESKVPKMMLGAITMAVLNNGLTLSGVSGDYSKGIQGVVLILVVFLTMHFRKNYGKTSYRKIKEEESYEMR